MRRRDLLRALGLAPALIACARRAPQEDIATWLAAALYGVPPAGEAEALRELIAARAAEPGGAALAAILGPPAISVERWDHAAWTEVREVLRRHIANSHEFRAWAGLGPKGRACGGLVPT